jgi:hypothetical protein
MFPESMRPYVEIMRVQSESDPAVAAEKLSAAWTSEGGEGFVAKGTEAAGLVAKNFAIADSEKALSWALSLPSGAWRERALSEAAGLTARSDPAQLSEWVNSAPPSPELDNVITQLVDQVPDDPQAAYAWATRISSPSLREEAQGRVLANWRSFDPSTLPPAAQPDR